MENFLYETQATRVIFGTGLVAEVRKELIALGAKKTLVLSTPGHEKIATEIAELIGDVCVGIHAKAIQHVPIEVVEEAVKVVKERNVDSLVSVGGGSSIGLAKAIALSTSLPIVAVPTTYAGSEMTPVWGITENGLKKTGTDLKVKPKTVIYDPTLTVTLPKSLTVMSAMNSMAHSIEGLYAPKVNPIISLFAEEGIKAISSSLPNIMKDPSDLSNRSKALYGCWLSGTVLGSVGMALHHKLCHVLGGSFGLQHAETHTVILPYTVWYNASNIPEAIKIMARALGTDEEDVAGFLFDFNKSLNAPSSLAEIGMKEQNLERAAELASNNPYYNPRSITKQSIKQLLDCAFNGERPPKGMEFKVGAVR
jgi:maleylacetate reductase